MTDRVCDTVPDGGSDNLDNDPKFKAYCEASKNLDASMFYTDIRGVSDESVYEMMVLCDMSPDMVVDPKDKAAYIAYIAKHKGD